MKKDSLNTNFIQKIKLLFFLLQLKVQEAMKKKDKLAREQEEVIFLI